MAIDTSFEIVQQLLKDAIDASPTLTAVLKTTLKLRVDELSKDQVVLLNVNNVNSAFGNVSLDIANQAILVAAGAPATPNRVEWDLIEFGTPVRIVGTDGVFGALLGTLGLAVDPAVDNADMSMQYRFSETDAWVNFVPTSVLDEVEDVQFALDIADQGAAAAVPMLFLIAQQL